MYCSRCAQAFGPADRIPFSPEILPKKARSILNLPVLAHAFASFQHRLELHRCPNPDCGGLVTVLYLPPAKYITIPASDTL